MVQEVYIGGIYSIQREKERERGGGGTVNAGRKMEKNKDTINI